MNIYFIATAHPEYAERTFPPGSTVIDPFRMVPDQEGVEVRRLGENRPEMISVLVPSRGRPNGILRLAHTMFHTATYERHVELIVYRDDDDHTRYLNLYPGWNIRYITGPRRLLSECWNVCAEHARGEILMHGGDDITFHTGGWDQQVRDAFAGCPDKILFVHGDDLGPHEGSLGTHGFLHRRWVDTVGYFVPPLFSSDWNDVWLTEVADALGRRVQLPFVTEHHHYTFGKAERDQTHAEREERGTRDDVAGIYQRTKAERRLDVEKLKAAMA